MPTAFVTKLAGTAADELYEFLQAEYIVEETCRRVVSLYLEDAHQRTDLANACRETQTREGVRKLCWLATEDIEGNWPGTASSHAAIACNYARDGITGPALSEMSSALRLACGRSRTRQDTYFSVAAQILDEAITLGAGL